MERKRNITLVVVFLLLTVLLFNWYIRIDQKIENREVVVKPLTVQEAREKYSKNLSAYNEYDERQTIMYVRSRTMIPFIFKNDTLSVNNLSLYEKAVQLN